MKSLLTPLVVLSLTFTSSGSVASWPGISFDIEVTAIDGDLSVIPDGLLVGDTLSVELSPADVEWTHVSDRVLRDLTIRGESLQLEAPFHRVKLNNYSFLLSEDRYFSGFGLGCHSFTDAEGCIMGDWPTESPDYHSWTAKMQLAVSDSTSEWPDSARWPNYVRSAEAWNLNQALRDFRIDVWCGRGGVGPLVATVHAEVGPVSIIVPEPSSVAIMLTLAIAAPRRRRS